MTSNSNHRTTCIVYQRPDVVMIYNEVRKTSKRTEDDDYIMPAGTRSGTIISDSIKMEYYAICGKQTGDRDRKMKSGRMVGEPDNGTDMYTEATDGGIIYYDTNDGASNAAIGMKKYIGQTLIK